MQWMSAKSNLFKVCLSMPVSDLSSKFACDVIFAHVDKLYWWQYTSFPYSSGYFKWISVHCSYYNLACSVSSSDVIQWMPFLFYFLAIFQNCIQTMPCKGNNDIIPYHSNVFFMEYSTIWCVCFCIFFTESQNTLFLTSYMN